MVPRVSRNLYTNAAGRTEPEEGTETVYSESPLPHASVGKNKVASYIAARSDSRRRSPQAKRTEVETRRRQQKRTPSRATSQYSESEDSEGGHWKSRSRRQKSNTDEDDLYQPWTCEERNPFTPRIRHFSLPRTRMPSHGKILHQQTKHYQGNPVDRYNHIKQRDGESTEDFMERYKAEVLDVEGAPECMRISGFMHGITHPGLIKRLYERIPRSMDEMYRMTTSFLHREVACTSGLRSKKNIINGNRQEGGNKAEISRKAQK
ncbi:hypothetical protein Tco_0740797 [Tanacetum coccineum]